MRSRFIHPLALLFIALLLPAALPLAGALTLDLHPNTVYQGDTVYIDITGLANQSTFNYTLTSTNLVSTGDHWYNLTSFNYPFALSSGHVSIVGNNVNLIKLETKVGGVTKSIQGVGPGTVTLDFLKDVTADVYDYYRINYDVANVANPVTITWIHNGTKSGPEDSTTSFNISGASAGDVRVLISVNFSVELDEVVTIISPTPTPTPTPTSPPGPPGPPGPGPISPPEIPVVTVSQTGTPTPTSTSSSTGGGDPTATLEPESAGQTGWKWGYLPPPILEWLGQVTPTSGQYGSQMPWGGGSSSWVILFGIAVLVIAVIGNILLTRKR